MDQHTVSFETSEYLVVWDREKIRFRCPIDLTDLGYSEPIDRFIARHGGVEAVVLYLRRLLGETVRRSMGLSHRES